MKRLKLFLLLGLAASLAGPALAQSNISVASGLRSEFVANLITGATATPITQSSGDTITGFTISPAGDIFACKTANVGEITRVYRVPIAYVAGAGGVQNVVALAVERLVSNIMIGAATGQTTVDVQGIAVDSGGTAYFADKVGRRIMAAEPDTDGDGFSNRIRVFAEFSVLSSPGNVAFAMTNGLTGDLYVSDTLLTGARVIYTVTPDANNDGYAEGWGRFATFNVNLPQPSVPLGMAFKLDGSGPSTGDLFVAHETVGLYRVLRDVDRNGQTDGILQLSSSFKGSLAYQTTATGGGGTDLYVTRALAGTGSNVISRLTFRSNGTIDTFTDIAGGFSGPVALAAGRRGDLFVVERQTGNLFRISQAGTQTVNVITTPGIGLVYTLPQLASYANSLLPGIAQIYSGTYTDFVFGVSVIVSQNDRLIVMSGQRMVFPGGRRLEIRGGLHAEGTNLNGFDLASGEFNSHGRDAAFISLAGFQQETGRMGVSFGKPGWLAQLGDGDASYTTGHALAALETGGSHLGVTFGYAALSSADLAGGWDGILFNQHNQMSELARFSVRYANRAITYQELVVNPAIADDNLVLEDGLIDSNHTGVYLNNTDPMIRRCVIQRNRILVVQSPGGGNTAAPESGTGIYATNGAIPLIALNYIIRNDFNGVAMLNSARPRLGRPAESFTFRNTGQTNVGRNNIRDNGFNAVFCNTSRTAILRQYAQNNYWGTTDPAEIEARIFHYVDNPSFSEVDFGQLLVEQPEIPLPITDTPPPGGLPSAVRELHWSLYR
ncbi:hypothetical protein HS125_19315 [bacterium]|nr:hypothetical protein [bacterium]